MPTKIPPTPLPPMIRIIFMFLRRFECDPRWQAPARNQDTHMPKSHSFYTMLCQGSVGKKGPNSVCVSFFSRFWSVFHELFVVFVGQKLKVRRGSHGSSARTTVHGAQMTRYRLLVWFGPPLPDRTPREGGAIAYPSHSSYRKRYD